MSFAKIILQRMIIAAACAAAALLARLWILSLKTAWGQDPSLVMQPPPVPQGFRQRVEFVESMSDLTKPSLRLRIARAIRRRAMQLEGHLESLKRHPTYSAHLESDPSAGA